MQRHNKTPTLADRDRAAPKLDLLVSGFGRRKDIDIDTIVRELDAIPSFHLAGLDEIVYDPKWETDTALDFLIDGANRETKGVFVEKARKILIFAFDSLDELRHVIYHEIGHHVFDRVIGSDLKKRWVTVLNPRSRHVTRYARRNAAEDFAESYAIFLSDPKRLASLTRKYMFLRDHVFGGIARNLARGHVDCSV